LLPGLICLGLLAGCGGGGSANQAEASSVVTPSESPVPGTSGVKALLGDGTKVYLISESTDSNKTKNMKIISNPEKTGGDPSKLVGKTFLEFENLSGVNDQVVVFADEKKAVVYRCDLKESKCISIGYGSPGNGLISFEVEAGRFYAIE